MCISNSCAVPQHGVCVCVCVCVWVSARARRACAASVLELNLCGPNVRTNYNCAPSSCHPRPQCGPRPMVVDLRLKLDFISIIS